MVEALIANLGVKTIQKALTLVQLLNLTAEHYPPPCSLTNCSSYDFIIVGAGTAGSVLANRLSKNSSISVALLETGGYPPVEAEESPALFPILTRTKYDYDYIPPSDNYTAQNLVDDAIALTAGKMLGGSSSLHHLLYFRGFPHDYDQWAEIVDDESWNYNNSIKYFKRFEKLSDKNLLESSYYRNYYGTKGMIDLTTEPNPTNDKYLESFKELGHEIENVPTVLGYSQGLFTIGDGVRQSTSRKYLGDAKSRSNLCVSMFTTATKIIIKDGVAIGVEATKPNGETFILYAKKEVIVCAGPIESPKLLMLSGIGPKSHLESLDIEVLVDLPVGQNFQDHPSAVTVYEVGKSIAPPSLPNLRQFGVPIIIGTVALDPEQEYADYFTFNVEIPNASPNVLLLCNNVFKYKQKICQKMSNANKGKILLFVINSLLMPKSRGEILLRSTDPYDSPIIHPRTFQNQGDLKVMAQALKDYHKIVNTSYFKSVNAKLVDLDLCPCAKTEDEFWDCYALKMSATTWHYVGTCAMGSVLDSSLRVKGIDALRVVDASSMPQLVRGLTYAAVNMLGEHAADLILSKWDI